MPLVSAQCLHGWHLDYNAHLFGDPFVHVGETQELLFDFHAFPSRPQPHADAPMNCTLNASFEDSIYSSRRAAPATGAGRQRLSPPYIVELDNYGCTNHPGVPFLNDTFHPFGWDEISWFAHQPDEYRNWWLGYGHASGPAKAGAHLRRQQHCCGGRVRAGGGSQNALGCAMNTLRWPASR